MTWTQLDFTPGIDKDNSPLKAGTRGRFIDADKIRFVDGLPETIYGWERASTSTLLGLCRGAITYADNARNPFAAFGTHLRLYAMDVDGNVTDITPVVSRSPAGGVSISFTTVSGSPSVTALWNAHGLVADQKFRLENATVATIGGVAINGTYTVANVVSANQLIFTAPQAANASAGPTASTVDTSIYLAPGQSDGLGGLGYGTGGFGTGGYGASSSSLTLFPRTWSLAAYGQDLLANPRGGAIYQWAPVVTSSNLVSNGDFASSAGWAAGAGWAIAAGVLTGITASSSTVRTDMAIATPGWYAAALNISSYTAGQVRLSVGADTVLSSVQAAGLSRAVVFRDQPGTYTVSVTGLSASLVITDLEFAPLATAHAVPNAPTQVGSMFVTKERIVVACGSNLDGPFDALQID
jgi:hypothetical protein